MCLSSFIFCIYLLGLSWWVNSYFCINVFILYYAVCGMSMCSFCTVSNFWCASRVVINRSLFVNARVRLQRFAAFLPLFASDSASCLAPRCARQKQGKYNAGANYCRWRWQLQVAVIGGKKGKGNRAGNDGAEEEDGGVGGGRRRQAAEAEADDSSSRNSSIKRTRIKYKRGLSM